MTCAIQRPAETDTRERMRYCTRCGCEVAPYPPSESLGHDDYSDYDEPIPDSATLRQPGDSAYRCPHCDRRWYAVGIQDTGGVAVCGHFMPVYVSYCALCGRDLRHLSD